MLHTELSGQKFIKNAKTGHKNAKIEKLKCDILGDFQTLCVRKQSIFIHFHKSATAMDCKYRDSRAKYSWSRRASFLSEAN